MESGIDKAIKIAGSQTALANRIGVSPQAVQKWAEQGYAPSERCRAIESELDGQVTRYELNPEVFGDPSEALANVRTMRERGVERRKGSDRRKVT